MQPLSKLLVGLITAATAAPAVAQGAAQLLWSNPWSNYTAIPSRTWTQPPSDLEAADDFELHGSITRVVFDGHGCFQCAAPTVTGVTVRFYAWNNGTPGALQYQTTVAAGSPQLHYVAALPETVDLTLPSAFAANGRHFVSMQVHLSGGGYWDVWSSAVNSPRLAFTKVRDRLGSGAWVTPTVSSASNQPLYADMTFQLWGTPAGSNGPVWVPCLTWSELPTASPPGATHCLLRDLKAFAPNDVWAAGNALVPQNGNQDEVTVAMHFDGVSWSRIPSPSPAPTGLSTCLLWAIDGVSSNDLWVAGSYRRQVNGGWVGQQVFAMQWNGSGWTVPASLPLPATSLGAGVTGASIYDLAAIAGNDVWFVGSWIDVVPLSGGRTTQPGLLLHWDGSNCALSIVPIVTGVANQHFGAVAATGSNDVWAGGGAGSAGNLPGSSVPVLFHFDGSNWSHRPCATPNLPGWNVEIYDIEALAPNDVYVFGVASTQFPTLQSQQFLSHFDGTSWTLLPAPPAGGAAKVISASDIYSVGSSVWHFDGSVWTEQFDFPQQFGAGLSGIDALGPCQLYAAGGQVLVGQVAPLAVRLDNPWSWRTGERLPTLPQRAPGRLQARRPPQLGNTMEVGIDDPGQALGAGVAVTFWMLALAPAPGYPAPMPFPIGGSGGSLGELFVPPGGIGYVSAPVLAPAAGTAVHQASIPLQPAMLGLDLFSQGMLLDAGNAANLIVTNGLDLHLGW